ncbi:hypothetical protein D3C87_2133410 [compost metagenome]
MELLVADGQVHHQVLVALADADHACCGQHVEDELLGGARFEPCRPGQDFWTDNG